jgi:MFS family permease
MAIIWFFWWKFLHLLGLVGFLSSHGVSIFVLDRIRKADLDRGRITQLISLSGQTTVPMYVSLAILLAGGIGAGLTAHDFWHLWLVVSIVILVVTVGFMTSIAAPYFKQITAACEVRPTGVPRKSNEELQALINGPKNRLINVIGFVGLLSILYLMIFKPWL